jgi:hypothetical protein
MLMLYYCNAAIVKDDDAAGESVSHYVCVFSCLLLLQLLPPPAVAATFVRHATVFSLSWVVTPRESLLSRVPDVTLHYRTLLGPKLDPFPLYLSDVRACVHIFGMDGIHPSIG